ncbi:MAG: toll/interleukin-1 receptor domain-containing protein [Pseudomonadota bacterium]
MADIFISYKREDKALAEDTIHQLEAAGFSVWYDERITPHTSWDETIEAEISAAKAVVVLWTPRSVLSEWVRTEADYAKEHGKLVPVFLEACSMPLAYRRTQTVDLANWSGDPNDRDFQKLVGWVRGLVDGTGEAPGSIGPAVSSGHGAPPRRKKGGMGWALPALAVLLIAGAGGLYATGVITPDMLTPGEAEGTTTAATIPAVAPELEAPSGPTPEEIAAQIEADRIAAERAAREERDRLERERLARIPSCFKIWIVADDKGRDGLNWDFPAPSPDPHVTSQSHPRLRFGCDNTYRCNSGNTDNSRKLERVTLEIMDEDIDEDDLMGSGTCAIPSTNCRIGNTRVDVNAC